MEEQNNLLVVICDVNTEWWAIKQSTNENCFKQCMESLLVFCNSYLMINHMNKLAFIACHTKECRFVYPKHDEDNTEEDKPKDGKFEVFVKLNDIVMQELQELVNLKEDHVDLKIEPSLLAGALTQALCYINNSMTKDGNSRILIMKGSPDVASQYMPVMNCIFAAQKNGVVIDSVSLDHNSGFLQQASDITNGNYFDVTDFSGLLQHLLFTFLPEPEFRKKLQVPSMLQIDYRAACFCHKQLVDIGFVCSVCLSIYCQFMPKCLTCQTRFKLPQLPMSKPKKKKKATSTGS